ncbi:hypothetical protein [Paraburkholderia strydomiana]|uniref:Uncharacterized protein n=1 Tax=Paraburkholderia strydomiana TaxID=1245417 RepID=A0ABW9BU10_9BURK
MDKFNELHAAVQKMSTELVESGAIPLSDEEMITTIIENMGVFYNHLPPIGFRAIVAVLVTLQSRA